MRRTVLLLMVMASTLLVASGVAWAVTKTCPPAPKNCQGTSGADVLKSTSIDNNMIGKGGNDTYYVKYPSGFDQIVDSGGKDKLQIIDNRKNSNVSSAPYDADENGKLDSFVVFLDPKGTKNVVLIYGYYDNQKSIPKQPSTWTKGPGYIELIQITQN
jgi:hypothetical protein